jgi:hypothetical protein
MKRYLILLLLISFCGGSSATIADEVTTTVVAPTSSTSTSTTTTIAKVSEEVKASELVTGDCFSEDGADGYYLSESTVVERVPCDVLHEFEVI